jgi:hypothetical protein
LHVTSTISDAAEARVNEIYFAWRTGEPTSLDGELDSMLSRWRALADGEELAPRWPTRQPATRRRQDSRRS